MADEVHWSNSPAGETELTLEHARKWKLRKEVSQASPLSRSDRRFLAWLRLDDELDSSSDDLHSETKGSPEYMWKYDHVRLYCLRPSMIYICCGVGWSRSRCDSNGEHVTSERAEPLSKARRLTSKPLPYETSKLASKFAGR